jgi:hypothetical protein
LRNALGKKKEIFVLDERGFSIILKWVKSLLRFLRPSFPFRCCWAVSSSLKSHFQVLLLVVCSVQCFYNHRVERNEAYRKRKKKESK